MGDGLQTIHIFDRNGGDQTWTGESACGEVRIAHRDTLATPTADGTSAAPRAVDVVLPHDAPNGCDVCITIHDPEVHRFPALIREDER